MSYTYDFPRPSKRPSSPSAFSLKHSHRTATDESQHLSRLLDPSYLPSPSSSQSSSSPPRSAYVDRHGDLHDPDYRHFPAMLQTTKSRRSGSHSSARPAWEHSYYDEQVVDDEDDPEEDAYDEYDPFRSTSIHPRRASSIPRVLRATHYPQYFSSVDPSPPSSFDSDDTILSEEDEYEVSSASGCGQADSNEKRCFMSKSKWSKKRVEETKEEHEQKSEEIEEEEEEEQQQQEWTPTCSQSMRRQWQAISLAFSLGVFRAQKRVRRRVGRG